MATVVKRGQSYKITASCGYDTLGNQIRRYFTWTPKPGMTERQIAKELERQKILFDEKCSNGLYIDGSIKFADFAEKWFTDYAEKQLAPSTIAGYRFYLKRTNDAIGHIHLDKLQPHHIIEFYNNLSEDKIRADMKYQATVDLKALLKKRHMTHSMAAKAAGLSVRTIDCAIHGEKISQKSAEAICKAFDLKIKKAFRAVGLTTLTGSTIAHYHRLLSAILSTAVKWQVIISNPATRVDSPKKGRKEIDCLDEDQAVKLIEFLDAEPIQFRTAVILLLYSGLRRGELCGLEWGDFDFKNMTVSVTRSSQYLPGKGVFTKDTKTSSSHRVMKLPDVTFKLLAEYKAWQAVERLKMGDQWHDTNRLFTTWNGDPLRPDTMTMQFKDFIRRHPELPDIHLHSLRHSNASLLIAAGTNVRTVSQRLGHSQTSTTMNIYTHAIQSADAAAAEALGDILNVRSGSRGVKGA